MLIYVRQKQGEKVMATKLDELKWKQYLKKRKKLYVYGAKN